MSSVPTSPAQISQELSLLLVEMRSDNLVFAIDEHIAKMVSSYLNMSDLHTKDRFYFLILFLNMSLRSGHICLKLDQLNETIESYLPQKWIALLETALQKPSNKDWMDLVHRAPSELVGRANASSPHEITPLILNQNRLYFQRMFCYERDIAHYFMTNVPSESVLSPTQITEYKKILDSLFETQPESPNAVDWQKVAVASALIHPKSLITGGPGTGKTTTVAKLLAALLQINSEKPLLISAATPTGKASARLTAALKRAIDELRKADTISEEIASQLHSITAVTLHQLLGSSPQHNFFKFNANNRLPADIILIDEASMVDISMMIHLIRALKPSARLILLGDKDQLASVEAGAVFGDLCGINQHQQFSTAHAHHMKQLTGYELNHSQDQSPIADLISFLNVSYRFKSDSKIGLLAKAINAGDEKEVIRILTDSLNRNDHSESVSLSESSAETYSEMIQKLEHGYASFFKAVADQSSPHDILESYDRFRILTAVNVGPWGVDQINKAITLNALSLPSSTSSEELPLFYEGRPVMIKENNSHLNLFNGDIGIVLTEASANDAIDAQDSAALQVYFLMPDGNVKGFSPAILPEHDTAYAMTIHKSQGSEFENVAIVLPDQPTPILSRSLLYTAVTRAKKKVDIYSSELILRKSIQTEHQRQSGLSERFKQVTVDVNGCDTL